MARKKFSKLREQVLARPGAEERVAALRQELLAGIGLYELRRARDVSQASLAEQLDVTQSAISKFEHGDDPRISTLRDYVAGLGGHLELRARFEDEDIVLSVAEDPEQYEASHDERDTSEGAPASD